MPGLPLSPWACLLRSVHSLGLMIGTDEDGCMEDADRTCILAVVLEHFDNLECSMLSAFVAAQNLPVCL